MGNQCGLWIGGKKISLNEQDLQSVVKYAIVPEDQWASAAFKSNNMGDMLSLADDLAVEIVLAMSNDSVQHTFDDAKELSENIALRTGIIAAMRDICAGGIDGDYVEVVDGVPPALGYIGTLEAKFGRGSKSGKSVLTKELPFAPPSDAWEHIAADETWSGFRFAQNPDVPLSMALKSITPFRGECAGALQLSIMIGCLNSYGAEKLDALQASYGPAFVGAWRFPAAPDGENTTTLATQFFSEKVAIPENYDRGSVIAVPGDYLYFQNKDDYPKLAPSGGWQGENCFYMGQDHLGNPHYSGLGLAWKTEFAFRMFLGNAYLNDTNAQHLKALNQGETPKTKLHIVQDAQKQIRFVMRALIRFPKKTIDEPPKFLTDAAAKYPLDDKQLQAGLEKLGFKQLSKDAFEIHKIPLGALMDTLAIGDRDLVQPPSAPFGGGPLCAQLNEWRLVIETVDTKVQHPDTADLVNALIMRSA